MEQLDEVRRLERAIQNLLQAIKTGIGEEVANQPFCGRVISGGVGGEVLAAEISLSSLSQSKILSPSYYLPKKQSDAVQFKLQNRSSVEEICSAVREMIREKRVRFSHDHCVFLNEETVRILRESEIGQYAEAMTMQ